MSCGAGVKLDMLKSPGGALSPASDEVADKLKMFKSGEIYPIEIKRARNPQFHGKVFAFFGFCFEHWAADKTHWENMSESSQKDSFSQAVLPAFMMINLRAVPVKFLISAFPS